MHSLCRIDISNLVEDNKDCEICFQRLGKWRWGNDHPVNAGALEPFKVLKDMMPEDPVKLLCGHYLYLDKGDKRGTTHLPKMQSKSSERQRS